MSRDAKVWNAMSLVGQHQENVQDLKSDRGHGEEVNRQQAVKMIVKKRPPTSGTSASDGGSYIC